MGLGRGKAFCRGEAWGQMNLQPDPPECVCMAEQTLLYDSHRPDTALFLGFM